MTRNALALRTSVRAIALCTLLLTPSLAFAQAAPSPYTSATRYDAANRVVGTIAPDPDVAGDLKFAATRTAYDASGRVIKVETGELAVWKPENIAPANWGADFTVLSSAETIYDTLDRKIQDIGKDKNGAIVSAAQYSYDAMGRLDCAATRMNLSSIPAVGSNACVKGTAGNFGNDRITKNVYNVASQLLTVKRAFDTPLVQDYATYTYTLNGKQATVKDANGNLASMTYDGHDRQTRWTFPSKTTVGQLNAADYEEYAYDANGNRTSLRKRDGSVFTYQYDALNRPMVKVVPERLGLAVTHTRDVYYGYDNRGLQLYARFDSASGEGVASSYDGFGRSASSSLNMNGTMRLLSYARNKNGNRTSLTWMDGQITAYDYDGLNRLTRLNQGPLGNGIPMVLWSYNKRGQVEFQNGRFSSARWYDTAGRLSSLQFDPLPYGPAHFLDYSFTYNPAQQIVTRSTSNDAYVWTGAVNISRNYAVNGLNQYNSAGQRCFDYDANGNLTADKSCAAPNDSSRVNYVYDTENRLVSASGATTASLRYDPLGRLYETGGAGSLTRFLHDGDELVAEYDGNTGVLLRRYAHGINVDDPVVAYEGAAFNNPKWLHANHQGSIVAISDNSGSVTAKNSYDEWGIPGSGNASIAAGGRFSYTGQAWIPELGMYYYKARIYSPTLGRFMQTDPVGYEGGVNIYAYVDNDPVNLTDPSGLRPTNCVIVGGSRPSCHLHDLGDDLAELWVKAFVGDERKRPRHTTAQRPTVGMKKRKNKAGEVSNATGGVAVGLSAVEHGSGKTTIRSDGLISRKGFNGNQHVSAVKLSKVAEIAGRGATVVSAAADTAQLANGEMSGGKFAANRTADAVGLFGGGIGAGLTGVYYLVDNFYEGGAEQAVYDQAEDAFRSSIERVRPSF